MLMNEKFKLQFSFSWWRKTFSAFTLCIAYSRKGFHLEFILPWIFNNTVSFRYTPFYINNDILITGFSFEADFST